MAPIERHHPTGRHAGRYLDPDLTVSIPKSDHIAEHQVRAFLGLDKPSQGPMSAVEIVEIRLRRLAVTLAMQFDLDLIAEHLTVWADELRDKSDRRSHV